LRNRMAGSLIMLEVLKTEYTGQTVYLLDGVLINKMA